MATIDPKLKDMLSYPSFEDYATKAMEDSERLERAKMAHIQRETEKEMIAAKKLVDEAKESAKILKKVMMYDPAPGTGMLGAGASVVDNPAMLDAIKKFAPVVTKVDDYGQMDAKVLKPPKTKEYTPPAIEPREGWVKFSEAFGWAPKELPDFLVPVFPREHWDEAVRWYIPDALPNEGVWFWPKRATENLCFALFNQEDRTLLHGPTGSGKSSVVMAVAHQLGIPVIRVNCHPDMQSTDFLGKDIIRATPSGPVLVYDWSLTTLAAKHGGILLVDEAFRSPCLMSIQSLLERHGTLTLPDAASLTPAERRIVPPKNAFWISLTDNTQGVGDDSGVYMATVQDVSTLDRITSVIHIPYNTRDEEADMLMKGFPTAPHKQLMEIASWAHKVRQGFLNKTFQHSLSARGTASVLRKYLATGNMKYAIQAGFLDKLTPPEIHAAKEAWFSVNGKELSL